MISKQTNSKEKYQEKSYDDFKKFFLLEFTRELIKHSGAGDILQLKNILKKEAEEKKEELKKEKREIIKIIKEKERLPKLKFRPLQRRRYLRSLKRIPHVLRIPEFRLPPKFQYLKPTTPKTPTPVEIDLGKLNPLIKDPAVISIECDGAGMNVVVNGRMGRKNTSIILNKEEINQMINNFSKKAKIPLEEGVFKVVVGRLILSAIISDVVGSKFIIKKIPFLPPPSSNHVFLR